MSLFPLQSSTGTQKQKQPPGTGPRPPTSNNPNATSRKSAGLAPGTGLKFQVPPNQSHGQAAEPTSTKCYIVDPPQEFDETGTELGRDAQVWKTYVKEADESDGERVDGWNKTLDVLLIFAALFSAISTAFVIESYQDLKEDPAEVSAETLRQISQTLLLMANGTQITLLNSPLQAEPTEFQPSLSAILVNALWFLSLTLSVSVSLVAMLAKEWCFTFMSGRTGSPAAQTRRRQQRWEGLVRWRMENMLMLLPSIIQLALLLFAVGLSIFLWDIHIGVAIPVVVSTGIAAVLYGICTILPFLDRYSPYGTTLTKICTMLLRINLQSTVNEPQQDGVTSRALHWIITNCETPRSVDVTLQSIAGATNDLPADVLEDCRSSTLIRQRFTAADTLRINPDHSLLLYSRALLFLEGERQSHRLVSLEPGGHPDCRLDLYSRSESSRLEILLWTIQFWIDSHISDPKLNITTTPWGQSVLDLCQIFTLQSAKALRYDHPKPQAGRQHHIAINLRGGQSGTVDIPFHLIESRESRYELSYIIFCMLLIFGLAQDTSTLSTTKSLMQFMRNDRVSRGRLGLILAAFAISRQDYPGWIHPAPLSHAARVERAVDFLLHYEYETPPPPIESEIIRFERDHGEIKLGVLHLMSFPHSYNLDDDDLSVLSNELSRSSSNGEFDIPTLPPSFNPCYQVMSDITSEIENDKYHYLRASQYTGANPADIQSCLQVLCCTYNRELAGAPTDVVYVFVLKCLRFHVKSDESAMTLFESFPFPVLSENLADLMVSYPASTVELLGNLLEDDDAKLKLLARSQLWLFTTLLLRSESASGKDSYVKSRLKAQLQKYDPSPSNESPEPRNESLALVASTQALERAQRNQAAQFSQVFRDYTGDHAAYFRRILFCMLSAENSPESDDRWELVGGFQSDETSRDFGHLFLPPAPPEVPGVTGPDEATEATETAGAGPSTPRPSQG